MMPTCITLHSTKTYQDQYTHTYAIIIDPWAVTDVDVPWIFGGSPNILVKRELLHPGIQNTTTRSFHITTSTRSLEPSSAQPVTEIRPAVPPEFATQHRSDRTSALRAPLFALGFGQRGRQPPQRPHELRAAAWARRQRLFGRRIITMSRQGNLKTTSMTIL